MSREDLLRDYLARGWRPIPLHHLVGDELACSCPAGAECGSPGKHPLYTSWSRPVTVGPSWWAWWAAHPRANVGLVTGSTVGFWVLDVDPRHGGGERLAELEARYSELPRTRTHATPSGGAHLLWLLPEGAPLTNSRGALPRGLDVRADGGQVAAPDSVGRCDVEDVAAGTAGYVVLHGGEVAAPPAWLVELVRGEPGARALSTEVVEKSRASSPAGVGSPVRTTSLEAHLAAALAGEVAKVAAATTGERNHVLNGAAFALGTILAHDVGEDFPRQVWAELVDAGMAIGLPRHEVEATVRSGVKGGKRKPREWPPPELDMAAPGLTELAGPLAPGAQLKPVGNPFSDANAAGAVARGCLSGQFLWCPGLDWLHWDGTRWAPCTEERLMEAVRGWVLAHSARLVGKQAEELARIDRKLATADGDAAVELEIRKSKLVKQHQEETKGWQTLHGRGKRLAVVGDCRGILEVDLGELDSDPHLLNTPSGVVDLRSGELLPHDPAFLMTKITHAQYRPGAESDVWKEALQALPDDVHEWYQVVAGQAATGFTVTEDWLLVTHGGGENGKGMVNNEGIATALGNYAAILSEKVLLTNPGDHPVELMQLQGVRLALMDETPEARHLDTQRLKRVLGQPTITARPLNQKHVTFPTSHTLLINTNHLPRIIETDHGTWRRLRCLTFPYTFILRQPTDPPLAESEREADIQMKEKLRDPDAQAAILAWIVAGAVKWFANAKVMLPTPPRVAEDTAAWRRSTDLLMGYLGERVCASAGSNIAVSELTADLNAWLDERGHQPWTAQLLRSRLSTHDLARRWSLKAGESTVRRGSPSSALTSRRPMPEGTVPVPLPTQYSVVWGAAFVRPELEGLEQAMAELPTPRGGERDDVSPFD